MQSLKDANALFIDWVRRRSFLLLPPIPGTPFAPDVELPLPPELTPRWWWLVMLFLFSDEPLMLILFPPLAVDDESGVPCKPDDDKDGGKW